jgi:RNA polymerase sigma factor (sigma-70 family)
MSSPETRDALVALIQRFAAGDEQALARFYDLTVTRVYGLARSITDSAADADDVACETYVQVWNDACRFDPARGSALGWLLSIARSRALDLRRRRHARARADASEAHDLQTAAPPEDLLTLMESGTAVHAAVARLSPLRRQLVALAFFRGLTHAEIAATLDLPLGTVKSHLRRALGALRETLATEL